METIVPVVIGALVAASVQGCTVSREISGRTWGAWTADGVADLVGATARRLGMRVLDALPCSATVLRYVDALGFLPCDRAERLGLVLIADAACGALGALVSLSVLGAVIGALVPWALLVAWGERCARTERRRIEAEMPEAFAALAIALGSGHSLAQGMRFVGTHAREPIKTEFRRVSFAIECGVPAASALDDLLERMPAPGLGLVSLALKVSQRTGAPLHGLLADAAAMVGERIELERQLDVKTSQARMSARLVAAMPFAMVVLLALLSVDYRAGLSDPMGAASVATSFGLNALAWLIIRRIMEVDVR